jgi:hypothetical protein
MRGKKAKKCKCCGVVGFGVRHGRSMFKEALCGGCWTWAMDEQAKAVSAAMLRAFPWLEAL